VAITYQQTDTSATFNVGCSGQSAGVTTAAAQASVGGTAGSTPITGDPDNNLTRACIAFDCSPAVNYGADWPAGTVTVHINISACDGGTQLTRVDVCDFDGSSTYQSWGSNTSPGHTRGTTNSDLSVPVTVTSITPGSAANSRVFVVLTFNNNDNHGASDVSVTPSLTIVAPFVAANYVQSHFRIRSADTVGLNADSGWAAAEDTNATIGRGVRFRIRFRIVEDGGGGGTDDLHLQCRLNGGTWLDVFPLGVGTGAESPAQAIYSLQFTDGDATSTQLLTSSGGTYVNGVGDSNAAVVTAINNEETEIEFCVQIMSTYDAGAHNEVVPSNTVDFRVVRGVTGSEILLDTYTNTPTVTVADTANYIGGCYVETPNRLGPFMDSNQNLYFFCEYAETFNDMTVRKSTDDGVTWRVIDGANRPNENDMEGADVVQSGTELYLLVVTTTVTFHSFRTSDAGTSPDTWQIKDQVVDGTYTPSASQQGCIEARSDGTFVAFYNDGASPARIHYRIRSSGGTWGGDNLVDTEAATNFTGVRTVKAGSDTIHIFYKDDTNGIVYHRTLSSGDSLSGRQSIATGISTGVTPDATTVLPPQYWNDGSEQVLALYQKAIDGPIFSKLLTGGTPGSELQATDFGAGTDGAGAGSDAPDATATLDPSYGNSRLAFVLYHRVSDGDLYRATYTPGSGWGTDDNVQTAVDVNFVGANVFTHANGKVLGYVYDDAAAGGSGQIWYGEVALDVILTPSPATAAFTATTPTVVQTVNPTPATAAFTATTPTVDQGGQSVTPTPAPASFAATTPATVSYTVNPTPATAAFSATTPTVTQPAPSNIWYPVFQAVMPWRT